MFGHCAPVFQCPSPAASFGAVHHSSSNSGGSASKATLPETASPMPIADLHDDESNKRNRNYGVVWFMFMSSLAAVISYWPDWQDLLVVAIMFSYWTAILLLLSKHLDEQKRAQEWTTPPPCEKSWVVQMMLVLTGIMVISMALILHVFPSKRIDAFMIGLFSMVAIVVSLLLIICCTYPGKAREWKAVSAGSQQTSSDLA